MKRLGSQIDYVWPLEVLSLTYESISGDVSPTCLVAVFLTHEGETPLRENSSPPTRTLIIGPVFSL